MTTDAPAYPPVAIRIVADDGTGLTLTRAHLEEIRADYPDSYDALDSFRDFLPRPAAVHRATFILLPDRDETIARIQRPQRDDTPVYEDLFRRYQP